MEIDIGVGLVGTPAQNTGFGLEGLKSLGQHPNCKAGTQPGHKGRGTASSRTCLNQPTCTPINFVVGTQEQAMVIARGQNSDNHSDLQQVVQPMGKLALRREREDGRANE